MKFLSLAVAALVGMTEGKKTLSAQQLKTRMSKGQFNKQTLMRGAKPYGETARRLDEQQQQEEQWEINGLFSVQFSSCVSLTVQDNDLFDENFIQYAKSGELVAEKSYIIFTACKSTDCYYQAEDEKLTFVTDIASFFQAFADFLPNQVENYCEGCNQNYDYCMGNLDAQQADDGGAAGDDGGAQDQQQQQQQGDDQAAQQNNNQRRKLSAILELPSRQLANNQVVQMIDCDMCNSYECFEDQQEQGDDGKADDGAGNYEFEDALEWLDALSQCQQMENAEYNNLGLYSGLICNSDGTGVEIGVFMDDACTLYAPKLNYGKLMSYADSQYFSMSEEVVEYMFTNDFSCYQPDIQYTNPYEYQQENNDDQADNDDAYPEAAEWCNNLYNGSKCRLKQNFRRKIDLHTRLTRSLFQQIWMPSAFTTAVGTKTRMVKTTTKLTMITPPPTHGTPTN